MKSIREGKRGFFCNLNRTVTASGAGAPSGFGRLGHGCAISTPPSPKFGRTVFASQSLYMPAQTSVTAGTLGEIPHRDL